MEISIVYWIGFLVFVVIMLMLDLGIFHKKDTEVKIKEAVLWSLFWISLALIFNVLIYFLFGQGEIGKSQALDFFTAYVLEKSLSVDNLFVFIVIFSYFNIAPKYQHKVLFWGIFGALIMRAIFIFAGVALIQQFSWIMYIFGAFLVYTGIHILASKNDNEKFDPNKNFIMRTFRKMMPVMDDTSDPRFFVRKEGILYATPFFLALLFIEISDVVFAIDSIPAVLSVSKDIFIVFTSNIFAILGLRSLYFALNGIMSYFFYLKYALAGILSFIGLKMCINEFCAMYDYEFHISNYVSLGIIVSLLTISIIFSVMKKNQNR